MTRTSCSRNLECSTGNMECFDLRLLRTHDGIPSSQTYAQHFGSFDSAFQRLYSVQREQAKVAVHEEICKQISQVLNYSDFLVLDQKLSLTIQPAVPVPHGYSAYWPIRADQRQVIDITLGVLLIRSQTNLRFSDTWRCHAGSPVSNIPIWLDVHADSNCLVEPT